MAFTLNLLDFAVVALVVFMLNRIFVRRRFRPLPPGPKGFPLIGNVLDMPTSHEWKTFAKWGDRWGDIISVTLFGQPIVVLNSSQHAFDVLEKKSAIYSDRPTIVVGGEMIGWNRALVLLPYGNTFREYRRLLFQLIGTRQSVTLLHPFLDEQTRNFIVRLHGAPNDVVKQVRKAAGSIILMMSHGYKVQEGEDPIVNAVDKATEEFALCTAPGAYLADIFPIRECRPLYFACRAHLASVRYIPSWFPGGGWKKTLGAQRENLRIMSDVPHEFVKRHMAAGTAIPSFTSANLEGNVTPEREEFIKWAATSLYGGRCPFLSHPCRRFPKPQLTILQTVSAINTFFLAMTCNPDVQRRAQQEIDAVIGSDRLPNSADREQLSYVTALFLEVLRWNPVAPLGVPHRLTEDDIHAGYLLPKGTIVIPNIWKFLHDPHTYEDPMTFNPNRFLSSQSRAPERDPREVAFGFGRRICPGLNLADASIWLSCAMSLAAFDISKATEDGVVIEPSLEYSTGTISHPPPFKCSIKPRSAKAEALIRSMGDFKQE
ncbi:O-methylsterigmatocystin oxidoreductase [Grifola frondosa]|uniref:O-methylsterigmatocystin oxidoreductase n=1 Tax=Grifola frondosa TaxID=5627 RepID=A0A1C7MHS5_GRIFR|nr:O-methylsterigmatocystin oxidoreductase [Grifola frondosa]